MAYANLDLDYFEHRKTKRLIGLLGRGAEILPIRLWVYCGKFHCEDGRFVGYSDQEIESILGWWGKPGEMLQAMLSAGFMHRENETIVVHDWLEHQGHIARFKQRGKDMAQRRWGKKVLLDATSNATSIPYSIPESNATSNAASNAPTVPTVPTESVRARMHEHREEGGGEEFAHVPTVEEVVARASLLAIPESFARHYHETCRIRRRWVTGQGKLIDWGRELIRWWSSDRATWKETPGDGRSVEVIEAEIRELQAQPRTPDVERRLSVLADELIQARKRK